jgi:hypothetical protein
LITKLDLSFSTSFKNAKTAKAKLAQSDKSLAFGQFIYAPNPKFCILKAAIQEK